MKTLISTLIAVLFLSFSSFAVAETVWVKTTKAGADSAQVTLDVTHVSGLIKVLVTEVNGKIAKDYFSSKDLLIEEEKVTKNQLVLALRKIHGIADVRINGNELLISISEDKSQTYTNDEIREEVDLVIKDISLWSKKSGSGKGSNH
jgi:hypothetical protein